MSSHRFSALVALVLLGACAGKPREFTPALAAPAPERAAFDQASFDQAFGQCRALVAKGYKSGFRTAAISTGAGVGAGYAVGSVMFTAASAGGMGTMAAVAGPVLIAMPIVGIAVGYGVSRAARSRKERAIKHSMGACLDEYGYPVTSWSVTRKPRR